MSNGGNPKNVWGAGALGCFWGLREVLGQAGPLTVGFKVYEVGSNYFWNILCFKMCWDHPFDYSKIMVPNFNSLKGGSGISDRESTGPTEIPAGEYFWDTSTEAAVKHIETIFRKLSTNNPSIWPYAQFNVTGSTPTSGRDHWEVSKLSFTQQVSHVNRAWHALKWFQLSVYFISTSHSLTCLGTPSYSRLRRSSTYMGEKEALILDDCLTGIVEVSPLIGVLENVYGLLSVWPEVGATRVELEYCHSIMNLSVPKCPNWKNLSSSCRLKPSSKSMPSQTSIMLPLRKWTLPRWMSRWPEGVSIFFWFGRHWAAHLVLFLLHGGTAVKLSMIPYVVNLVFSCET